MPITFPSINPECSGLDPRMFLCRGTQELVLVTRAIARGVLGLAPKAILGLGIILGLGDIGG